jgi:hypothetical protein
MNWKRSLPTAVFLSLLALASWEGSRWLTEKIPLFRSADDLAWIRKQYRPDAAHWEAIQALHQRHQATRDALARQLEMKARELTEALDRDEAITRPVQELLDELGALRGQCHVAALRHTLDVSRQLSPDDSRHHLVEVERQLLGLEPGWHQPGPSSRGLAQVRER